MSDKRPSLGGWYLPQPKTVFYVTIIGSVASYFVFHRAAANLVAIIGGIALTIVLVVREKSK